MSLLLHKHQVSPLNNLSPMSGRYAVPVPTMRTSCLFSQYHDIQSLPWLYDEQRKLSNGAIGKQSRSQYITISSLCSFRYNFLYSSTKKLKCCLFPMFTDVIKTGSFCHLQFNIYSVEYSMYLTSHPGFIFLKFSNVHWMYGGFSSPNQRNNITFFINRVSFLGVFSMKTLVDI